MNDIISLVLVLGLWAVGMSAYLHERRRDRLYPAVGTAAALLTASILAWDLKADLGGLGNVLIVVGELVVLGWAIAIGWKYMRPSS